MAEQKKESEVWFKMGDKDDSFNVSETMARWMHRGIKAATVIILATGVSLTIDSAIDIGQGAPELAKDVAGVLVGQVCVIASSIVIGRSQSEADFIASLEEVRP